MDSLWGGFELSAMINPPLSSSTTLLDQDAVLWLTQSMSQPFFYGSSDILSNSVLKRTDSKHLANGENSFTRPIR